MTRFGSGEYRSRHSDDGGDRPPYSDEDDFPRTGSHRAPDQIYDTGTFDAFTVPAGDSESRPPRPTVEPTAGQQHSAGRRRRHGIPDDDDDPGGRWDRQPPPGTGYSETGFRHGVPGGPDPSPPAGPGGAGPHGARSADPAGRVP
ncbi:MAG: hypothetical protein J2P18_17645, partial [Nocardia sp.]|nr:hypothetical protein [Nocardia sp.]